MPDPRSACISPLPSSRSSRDPYVIRPVTDAPRGSSRKMARQVRLLPDPLSPTRPNASPEAIVNDTPRTTGRRSLANVTVRPSTSRASLGRMDPTHDVRRAVADEAHEEAGDDGRDTGEDHHPRRGDYEVAALGDHHAPLGCRGLHAEAEEAQRGAGKNVQHEVAHAEDQGRHDHIRQQMAKPDARVAVTEAPGGQDGPAP